MIMAVCMVISLVVVVFIIVVFVWWSLSLSFFGQVMSSHLSDQMSQRSQVSGVTL